jgi:hypothetical protein
MKTAFIENQKSLAQWVSQATGINSLGVKVRLRGNDLHILCESHEVPPRWNTLSDLLKALQQTDLDALTKSEQPSIYQVFVYGKKKSEKRPEWCHKVYLNQLDKHLEQVNVALLTDPNRNATTPGALILSNESLARQGDPLAIARYLSETLSTLGVAVQVKVKQQKTIKSIPQNKSRLWVFCQSNYTPDPSLIAEPVAAKLRNLKLSGYQDAVISTQVVGETQPDWLLLVDLTPPEVMLKEWARWGDVQAIVRLLNIGFANLKVKVEASLQDETLHVFCTHDLASEDRPIPDKTMCLERIAPTLEALAPQGILSAAIYGQQTAADSKPAWIDWLSLPAKEHPALATLPMELARQGDIEAITFLLQRLLNPSLERRLKTGGIRVLLMRKRNLLHIMCDAPVCPARKQVAAKVINLIKHLQLPDLEGVRVYGRRAGNKKPFWQSGDDFKQRQRVVPEATPEFAATSAYVQELLPNDDEAVLRPDLTAEEVHSFVADVGAYWGETVKNWFLRTQLFVEKQQPFGSNSEKKVHQVALIWGSLGLLLTLQTDWVLGQILTSLAPPTPIAQSLPTTDTTEETTTAFLSNTTEEKSNSSSVFNGSGFTRKKQSERSKATATAILLAARSPLPSFNSRQLNEQLALYKQRLAKNGQPPDVLIIGSSRALRGVDPDALSKGLASIGYPDIDVFNFGINGATAQVVDFIIRRVLQPSELPRTIIWADGSRAFNSGRADNTFEAIAASPGYQYALSTSLARQDSTDAGPKTAKEAEIAQQKSNGYQVINDNLNQGFATVSSSYDKRDILKSQLNKIFKSLPIISTLETDSRNESTESEDIDNYAVDFDGFLPLSTRFNPNTYYQKHPKVVGNYDQDYQNFDLVGEQNAALQALLNYTESRNINVVFVNMPLTAEYLDPFRQKYEQEFEQYMLDLASRSNFVYRDLSQIWTQANDYFSDPSHLNRYGAYEVSKKLAKDPMIPWSAK